MLQKMRDNSQNAVAKVIVGLIAIGFVFFGYDAFWGGSSSGNVAATVNGQEIPQYEFQRALQTSQQRQLNEQPETDPSVFESDAFQKRVLNDLISLELARQQAASFDFSAPAVVVQEAIRSTPALQKDGAYDPDYAQMVIERAGYGVQEFMELMARDHVLRQLDQMNAISNFMTAKEQKDLMELFMQTRKVEHVMLTANDYVDQVELSDEEIKTFYDANQDQYQTAERYQFSYIELNESSLEPQIQLTAEDLKSAYAQEVEVLKEQGGSKIVSHILLESESSADAALKDLQSGQDFAAVASSISQDPASSSVGGDLGPHTAGYMGDDFDAAVEELEVGSIYDVPVKSDFGWHLIKVTGTDAPVIPAYSDMEVSLKERLRRKKLDGLMAETSRRLAELAFESETLEAVATELGLDIQESKWVERTTKDELIGLPVVSKAVFTNDVLDGYNSEVVSLDSGRQLVFHIQDREEPSLRPYEEVKAAVKDALAQDQAASKMKEVANNLIESINSSGDFKKEVEALGLEVTTRDVGRRLSIFPEEMVQAVFTSPVAQEGEVQLITHFEEDAVDLANVVGISTADQDELQQQQVGRILEMQEGFTRSSAYQAALRQRADVSTD